MTVPEILQTAVKNYNLWVSKKENKYDPIKCYADLRGILFNKICSLIQEGGNPLKQSTKHNLGRYFIPDNLICKFNEQCILTNIQIERPQSYTDQTRFNILASLQEATPSIIYEVMCEDTCYQISTSISNIENFKVQL